MMLLCYYASMTRAANLGGRNDVHVQVWKSLFWIFPTLILRKGTLIPWMLFKKELCRHQLELFRLPSLVLFIGSYRKMCFAIWDLISVMQKCFLNYLLGIGFRSLLLHCHARRGRDCLVADWGRVHSGWRWGCRSLFQRLSLLKAT